MNTRYGDVSLDISALGEELRTGSLHIVVIQ